MCFFFVFFSSSSAPREGSNLNRKDELYNDVLTLLGERGVDFPAASADSEGSYFVQVQNT